MTNFGILTTMERDMDNTINLLRTSIQSIRGGVITAGMIDTIKVEYCGQMTPLKHLATIIKVRNVITINPYDTNISSAIAKTLKESGFNSYLHSKDLVYINIPAPSGEEKKKIKAHLNKLGEEARIAIRNIRKKYRQQLSKTEADELDEDIQSITDSSIFEVDDIIENKVANV